MKQTLSIILFLVPTILFIAVFTRLYFAESMFAGIVKDRARGGVNILRVQFLLASTIGPFLFLITTVYNDDFPKVPEYLLTLLGLSGTGYMTGKGYDRFWKRGKRRITRKRTKGQRKT